MGRAEDRMAIDVRRALVLGAIQGVTEALPVSSSAHLAIARRLLGLGSLPRSVDVLLHAGTAVALVVVTRHDLWRLGRGLLGDLMRHGPRAGRYGPAGREALLIGLANLPAVVAGSVLHGRIDQAAGRPLVLGIALAGGAVAMAAAGRARPATPPADPPGPGRALAIGLAQAAALFPGVSRSGATLAAALLVDMDRAAAVRFSFLLAAPRRPARRRADRARPARPPRR
jgi:undecaprenyl-diphosphatase